MSRALLWLALGSAGAIGVAYFFTQTAQGRALLKPQPDTGDPGKTVPHYGVVLGTPTQAVYTIDLDGAVFSTSANGLACFRTPAGTKRLMVTTSWGSVEFDGNVTILGHTKINLLGAGRLEAFSITEAEAEQFKQWC